MNKSIQIGLVLSGGGIRGVGHVALLKVLEKAGVRPHIVSGVSMGAIVGAFYAEGYAADEMLAIFKEAPMFKLSTISISKPGLLNSDKNIKYFEPYFSADSFESLSRKLYVTTTNLQQGKYEVFSEGRLFRPLMASSALPPVFSPVEIEGQLHTDGCIMNSFPIEPLIGKCHLILGSSVNDPDVIGKRGIRNSFDVAIRSARLRMQADAQIKFPLCDYLFAPPGMATFNALSKRGIEKIYDFAYEFAQRDLAKIRQIARDRTSSQMVDLFQISLN